MSAMAADAAFLLALLATMAIVLHSTEAAAIQASPGAPRHNNTKFIRRSCSSTTYPSVCYASLARYAAVVAEDPIQLARVAANVSLARVTSAYLHVSSLCRATDFRNLDERTASALQTCEMMLEAAVDESQDVVAELALLATAKGSEVALRVLNARIGLDAVCTEEDSCTDSFTDKPGPTPSAAGASPPAEGASPPASAVQVDISRRLWPAKQYASNALALVSKLAGTDR